MSLLAITINRLINRVVAVVAVSVVVVLSSCSSLDLSSLIGGATADKSTSSSSTPQPSAKAKERTIAKSSKKSAPPKIPAVSKSATQAAIAAASASKRAAEMAASFARAELGCKRAGENAAKYQWTLRIASYDNEAAAKQQYERLSRAGYPVYLRNFGGVVGLYAGRAVSCWDALVAKKRLDAGFALDTVIERAR